jgi:hypothetical protein
MNAAMGNAVAEDLVSQRKKFGHLVQTVNLPVTKLKYKTPRLRSPF